MSIKVHHISKKYGEQFALRDVSFEIGSGEVVGFLGPNGAGKSTMMKILTCYLPPNQGSAEVCGFDVNEDSIQVRKKVGYLPEHNPLYLDMYISEYLQFVGGIYKMKNLRTRVQEMIELVGLTPEKKKKIGALSKGYRQRVGLAQALIHDPEVLILDEPTSGLDPNQLEEIRNLIIRIGKEKTVMLSTHIMQEVEAICNRVIIINEGEIVADKTTEQLTGIGESDEEVLLVEFDGEIDKSLLKTISGIKDIEELGKGKIRIKSSEDIRSSVFELAVKEGLKVLTLQKEETSMEDVFKKLTKK